ncbi:MAG: 50S ribosomal protein L15 [Candidatus Pacebacteria bacterium]|nr:50S ribosomal protein L15 [Candidatus Paceibacterota bacterium]
MQLHQLKRKNSNKKSVSVGRGGKRGKTSGRGHKGQNARAGTSKRPEMREIIKKLPKKRGYRFKSFQERPEIVNLSLIENNFSNGEEVSPKTLLQKSLIRKKRNKIPAIKILAKGDISKKVIISDCLFSQTVKDKVEKIGGKLQ